MQNQSLQVENFCNKQLLRYFINGVIATAVHYSILTINLNVIGMKSAGIANLLAALVGISISFLGGRYYVFQRKNDQIIHQAGKFILLYAMIAFINGLIMFGWTDIWHLDYRFGFIIATCMQFFLSYWGNKIIVFDK